MGGEKEEREAYGFTLALTSAVAYVVLLLWSFVPEFVLHSFGVYYYPDKWWAVGVPAWIVVAIVFIFTAYVLMYHTNVPPLCSPKTYTDDYARGEGPMMPSFLTENTADCIPPPADIPLQSMNSILFRSAARPRSAASK